MAVTTDSAEAAAAPAGPEPSNTKAAVWMAGWLSAMLVMAVAGREATRELHVFQIMEMRSVIGLVRPASRSALRATQHRASERSFALAPAAAHDGHSGAFLHPDDIGAQARLDLPAIGQADGLGRVARDGVDRARQGPAELVAQ